MLKPQLLKKQTKKESWTIYTHILWVRWGSPEAFSCFLFLCYSLLSITSSLSSLHLSHLLSFPFILLHSSHTHPWHLSPSSPAPPPLFHHLFLHSLYYNNLNGTFNSEALSNRIHSENDWRRQSTFREDGVALHFTARSSSVWTKLLPMGRSGDRTP